MSLIENIKLALNLVLIGEDKDRIAEDLLKQIESSYIKKRGFEDMTVGEIELLNGRFGLDLS